VSNHWEENKFEIVVYWQMRDEAGEVRKIKDNDVTIVTALQKSLKPAFSQHKDFVLELPMCHI